jgi:hypothetical protein
MESFSSAPKGLKTKEESNGNHLKIYMQVDGNACYFEIIINYYFHTILLDASACKKRTLKASIRS